MLLSSIDRSIALPAETERPEFTLSANQLRMFCKDIKCSADVVAKLGLIVKQTKQARSTFASIAAQAQACCSALSFLT